MNSSFEYKDPIISQYRTGKGNDPYRPYIDSPYKVVDGIITLNEFPVKYNRVQIKDITTTPITHYTEIKHGIPKPTQYYVDYALARIIFNDEANGKTLAVSFSGRGNSLIPASRVYTKTLNGQIIETLEELTNRGEKSLDHISKVQEVIDQSRIATQNAIIATSDNQASGNYANEQGIYAKAQGDEVKAIQLNLVNKGDYNDSAVYHPLNIVIFEHALYQNIVMSTGIKPTNTTHWVKILDTITGIDWNAIPNKKIASETEDGILSKDSYSKLASLPRDVYSKSETNNKIETIVGSAPESLNTLKSLANALGNDSSFSNTISTQLNSKVNKEDGKNLSTNDYTSTEKKKLEKIEEGASATPHPVVSDSTPTDGLVDGLVWFNPAKKETKIFLNNDFHELASVEVSLHTLEEKTKEYTNQKIELIDKINRSLSFFPHNFTGLHSPYNFATITGIRGGVEFTEIWILVNAYYDYETNRFRRINLDNFSFGWQLQGGGTYPGEENIGDFINQGMNLWKANGKKAFGINDPIRELITEDIGIMENGNWREFGIMLGWNNVFMCDSYGGMTIGGAGFEIDGSGTSPFKRVSLGKFSGGSIDPNRNPEEYVYAYNGTLWNAQHGLWNMDERKQNSFYWGMESAIDFYDGGFHNPGSNRAKLEGKETKWIWKILPKHTDAKFENWKNLFEISEKGDIRAGSKSVPAILEVEADIVNVTDFNMNYPDESWTKKNTFIVAVKGVLPDGSVKQQGNINATFTDYGIFGYLGNEFTKALILISKY